jgi:large subunit ribosomal protein L25
LKDFKKIWQEAGESTVIHLNLGKFRKEVLIQDVAMDPIKDEPIHVDFYAVLMDKPIQAPIPLVFEGEPPAIKKGGILVKVMHEIEVEALPKNLPHELIADISKLANFEDKILAKDIILPKDVKLITNPDEVVALIEEPKKEEAAPPAEEKIAFEEIEVAGAKEKEEKEEEKKKEEEKE